MIDGNRSFRHATRIEWNVFSIMTENVYLHVSRFEPIRIMLGVVHGTGHDVTKDDYALWVCMCFNTDEAGGIGNEIGHGWWIISASAAMGKRGLSYSLRMLFTLFDNWLCYHFLFTLFVLLQMLPDFTSSFACGWIENHSILRKVFNLSWVDFGD